MAHMWYYLFPKEFAYTESEKMNLWTGVVSLSFFLRTFIEGSFVLILGA